MNDGTKSVSAGGIETMQRFVRILTGTIAGILLIAAQSASGQDQTNREWKGRLRDGTTLTRDGLYRILERHQKWLSTDQKEGEKAALSGANLRKANLSGIDLRKANLSGADLSWAALNVANLSGTDLVTAVLNGAILIGADLSGAKLLQANLSRATLSGANLSGAILGAADLSGADLTLADLSGANLVGADLGKAKLVMADLSRADLLGANLSRADLSKAKLREAKLVSGVTLSGANLSEADLTGADLIEADLSFTDLSSANLSFTDLSSANLNKANLWKANLAFTIFELKPGPLPEIPSLARAKNLSQMTFSDSPHSLREVREAFKQAGLREQEREITYAIEHSKRTMATRSVGYANLTERALGLALGYIESAFKLIFFELTCQYGMSPKRPLIIVLILIPAFSVPYMFALKKGEKARIWAVWSEDRIHKEEEEKNPVRMTALWVGLYLSILSAFHIGWRDLNAGNWIARIQPREYTLRATGWVRTVSSIQSLICVYLLALWALTSFGRPFE